MKKVFALALVMILALSVTACGGGNPGSNSDVPGGAIAENDPKNVNDPPQTPEAGAAPSTEPGVYVLFAEGTARRDVAAETGEGEGFFFNYSFSIYACQTNEQSPPGSGGYEGVAKLSGTADADAMIGGMLEGLPASVNFDMSSKAFGRSVTFDLHRDNSESDAVLSAYCEPIFEGGKQFSIAASVGGFDTSQSGGDTGACPLPMTIEVFGNPEDSVRPALITVFLCEGTVILQFEGTLRFVPWSGSGSYADSDAFKAEVRNVLGE